MKALLFILTTLFSQLSFGQTFFKPIGGTSDSEGGASLEQHSSGDYFIGGFRNDSSMVMRTTANGDVLWARTYDFGPGNDYISSLRLTSSGDIIGTGCSTSGAVGDHYALAFRLDINGTPIWQQQLKYPNELTRAFDIREMQDGHFICGMAMHQTSNHSIAAMVKLDQNSGNIIWDTTYFANSIPTGWDEDWGRMAIHPVTKDIYTSGRFQTGNGQMAYRPIIAKFDSTGAYQWSRITQYTAGISGGRMYGADVEIDGDSIAMLLIGKNGSTSATFDIGMQKLDLNGVPAWNRFYTSASGYSMRNSNIFNVPNGYIISGYYVNGNQNLYLVHLNKQGTVIWAKTYGTTGTERHDFFSPNNSAIFDGNHIVLTGTSNGFGGIQDILLIKVDLATGEIASGACSDDLILNEIPLPNYSELYPLNSQPNLMTQATVSNNATTVNFEEGNLVEVITDTIVSNDTLFVCQGAVDVLADWGNGYTYQWNTGATTAQINIAQSGMYTVEVGLGGCVLFHDTVYAQVGNFAVDLGPDQVVCDTSTIVTLDASNYSGNFLWQDGSNNQTYTVNSSGTYWVEINDNGCTGYDTVQVDYITPTPLNLGPDTSFCSPNTLLLDASSNPGTYQWQDGSSSSSFVVTNSGTYWVEIDTMGCIVSDTINVVVVPGPTLDLGPDTTLCDAIGPHILDATQPSSTYLWQDGSTSPTYAVTNSGQYTVTVDNGMCTASDTIDIVFSSTPSIDLGNDTIFCNQVIGVLDASCTGCTYEWQDGSNSPNLDISAPGVYTVSVDVMGCSVSDEIEIFLQFAPNISINNIELCEGSQELITLPLNGSLYEWQNGSNSNSQIVSEAGNYAVITTNTCGTDTSQFTASYIECFCDIYVPNSFTPNDDEFNGLFRGYTTCALQYYQMIVYNCWGQIVFESDDINRVWDATYKGKMVQDGTYTWTIKYAFSDWVPAEKVGHVNIIR